MTIWLYVKYYPSRHSSFRRSINSAQIEKSRDRRSSLEGGHREFRELKEIKEFKEFRGSGAGRLRGSEADQAEAERIRGKLSGAGRLENLGGVGSLGNLGSRTARRVGKDRVFSELWQGREIRKIARALSYF